jgi:hypothetical protein
MTPRRDREEWVWIALLIAATVVSAGLTIWPWISR